MLSLRLYAGTCMKLRQCRKKHNPLMRVIHLYYPHEVSKKACSLQDISIPSTCGYLSLCYVICHYVTLSVIMLRYGNISENVTNQTNVKFCVNVTC